MNIHKLFDHKHLQNILINILLKENPGKTGRHKVREHMTQKKL